MPSKCCNKRQQTVIAMNQNIPFKQLNIRNDRRLSIMPMEIEISRQELECIDKLVNDPPSKMWW